MASKRILATALVAALWAAGCGFQQKTVIGPSGTGSTTNNGGGSSGGSGGSGSGGSGSGSGSGGALVGTWSSDAIVELSQAGSCADFQWQITSQTSNSIAGTFSAVCGGSLTVTGSGTGQLNGDQVPITVSGTVNAPGLPPCNFSLAGVGTITNGDTLTIPYSGTTCVGPVHGTETLHKRTSAPPADPPPPTVAPAPAADPLLGCGGIADHLELVRCIHDRLNPPHTVDGAFDVTRRVAWALRGEGAGLLIKNAGDNIVSWQGYSFSAGRLCYPDGHIYKILSDIPATNGPEWLDNGFVSPTLYVPAMDPTR